MCHSGVSGSSPRLGRAWRYDLILSVRSYHGCLEAMSYTFYLFGNLIFACALLCQPQRSAVSHFELRDRWC